MTRRRDHGASEAIHLTAQNFAEALVANQGLIPAAGRQQKRSGG